jgi:AcrR family transcriptional regulator
MTKLSLSEVAAQAGVSRPTLYRWFASKQELLEAFVLWERQYYERGVAKAVADLPPAERLDAALRVIAEYQRSYPGFRMVDIEPEQVIARMSQALPAMRSGIERLISAPNAPEIAATIVRVAVSHYLVRSDDEDEFLEQLRYAARVRTPVCESPAVT